MYQKSALGSLVAFLLASSYLVSLCNGSCFSREARLSDSGERPDCCMDGDTRRELDSTWYKEDCIKCTCDSDGEMNCCKRSQQIMPIDPACEAVLNQTSCTYTIKRKDNSDIPCSS